MLTYLYRWGDPSTPDGHLLLEREFEPGKAPETIVEDGRIYRRVYTAPGIGFKGKGFYATDYKGKS